MIAAWTIGVISLLTLLTSARLFRLAAGEPLWRVNMISFPFWLLFGFSYVAAVVVALDVPFLGYDPETMREHYMLSSDPRVAVWMLVMWMFIAMPLGALAVDRWGKGGSARVRMAAFRERPFVPGLRLDEPSFFIVVACAMAVAIAYNLASRPDVTALDVVLAGSGVVEGQIARRAAVYGAKNILLELMFNISTLRFLTYVAFAMAYRYRNARWTVLCIAGVLSSLYLALSTGTIGDSVWFLFGLAMVRALLGGAFVRLVEFVAAAIGVAVLFSFFKGYADSSLIDVLLNNVVARVFFSQLFGTYLALDLFPSHHAFIGFASAGRIIHDVLHLPFSESYGIELMRMYNPEGVEAGSAGHMTTIFMGEAWCNFGILGVIFGPLYVGGVVQAVNRWFQTRERSAVSLALYAFLGTTFGYVSDILGFYYPLGTISFVIGALGLLWGMRTLFVFVSRQVRLRASSPIVPT